MCIDQVRKSKERLGATFLGERRPMTKARLCSGNSEIYLKLSTSCNFGQSRAINRR
jgi:hypothetical protein